MAYTKYSLTPADNNAAPPNGAPEGMLPSAVNDTMRDMMAQIRDVGDGIRGGTYTMTAPIITGGSITGVALTGNTFTNPIISGGTITSPAITGGSITGITDLAVADGGTGRSTLTANAVLVGNGTSGINFVAPSTSGNVLTSDGTSWTSVAGAYPLTSGTAVASTSGTSIDFTGIPSWVKRITVMFNGVSLSGGAFPLVQLGDSDGVETSGYLSYSSFCGTSQGGTSSTAGFIFNSSTSANLMYCHIIITLLGSNTWVASSAGGLLAGGSPFSLVGGGNKTLSDVLDRVRITTSNGTDTFDAGSINILYE